MKPMTNNLRSHRGRSKSVAGVFVALGILFAGGSSAQLTTIPSPNMEWWTLSPALKGSFDGALAIACVPPSHRSWALEWMGAVSTAVPFTR